LQAALEQKLLGVVVEYAEALAYQVAKRLELASEIAMSTRFIRTRPSFAAYANEAADALLP